jgi:hypothetical protein
MARITLEDGTQVSIRHTINPGGRGGMTEATAYKDGTPIAYAVARCRPDELFMKPLGQEIATGRLMAELNGTAERRRQKEQKRVDDTHRALLRAGFVRILRDAKRWPGYNLPLHEIRAIFLRAYDEVMK